MLKYINRVGCRKIQVRIEKVLDGGFNFYVERWKNSRQTLYKVFFERENAMKFYQDKIELMKKYHKKEENNARRVGAKIR